MILSNPGYRAINNFTYNFCTNPSQKNRAIKPIQELPAGIVFAGINVPDHDLLFQQIANTLSSPTPPKAHTDDMKTESTISAASSSNHVAILQSKDCSHLKSALKSMIEQFLSLEIEGAINPFEVRKKNRDESGDNQITVK